MFKTELFRILAEADPCDMDLSGNCGDPSSAIGGVAGKIANTLFIILGVVSVLVIIYGGFIMMTSAGDPGKVAKGKKAVLGAVIGLIISICAVAISSFVVDHL